MKKFTSIISIISVVLLNVNSENLLHIHINDENNENSFLDGYELNFIEDNNISTIDSSEVTGKAIVDAINNESINITDTIDSKNESLITQAILLPMLALFCVCAVASIGFLLKKSNNEKSKPKRRSLHFEDDDELSKILVQSPAASAVSNESFTIRNITKESGITKGISGNQFLKKEFSFLPINKAYKTTLPWNPQHVDEIQLNVGDIVCAKKCYSDGYSYGRNVTTRVEGVFPTCCLSAMEDSIDQAAIEDWVNTGMIDIKKRTTSLFLNNLTYKI